MVSGCCQSKVENKNVFQRVFVQYITMVLYVNSSLAWQIETVAFKIRFSLSMQLRRDKK